MNKLLSFFLVMFALSNATAQLAHTGALPVVENQIQVGKMTINLPAGPWRVLQVTDARTSIDSGQSQGGQVERKYLIRLNIKESG